MIRDFRAALMALACVALAFGGSAQAGEPFVLFPSAAKVRVYGAPTSIEMEVDKTGAVKAWGLPARGSVKDRPVPVLDGGWLSPSEIAALRGAVRLTRDPPPLAACCSPRHAFLFYDRAGRYVGVFEACFECGCTHVYPRPPGVDTGDIVWDQDAIRRIVEAHRLGPVKARRR